MHTGCKPLITKPRMEHQSVSEYHAQIHSHLQANAAGVFLGGGRKLENQKRRKKMIYNITQA